MHGELFVEGGADGEGGFVGPGSSDVAGCVASSAENEKGYTGFLYKGEAFAVSADVEVELAQTVAAEGIGTALKHDGLRTEVLECAAGDHFEKIKELFVVDAFGDGDV